jgi:hypothetical protein
LIRIDSFRYTHAGKVWNFLRYDRSNRVVLEGDSNINKTEHQPISPPPAFGPVPLFKWPETKTDQPEESMLFNVNQNKIFRFVLNFLLLKGTIGSSRRKCN